ncbi:MAG: hypothetical protein WC005_06575 [Candidatus Nanopelagicales bacterium]
MSEVIVAIGAARHLPADIRLDLGDLHPTQHGGMQLFLTVDDGFITAVDPRIGFMHRSAEKLFEARDYRQLMMLANRHDWVSAFSAELSIALVLEDTMGILPPERATWSRMLLAEMNRVTAALIMLGSAFSNLAGLLVIRERLLALLEQLTGSRIHPMFNRIGGIAHECSPDWLAALAVALESERVLLEGLPARVADECEPLSGIGVITSVVIDQYGLSGTMARASNVPLDLRVQAPYLAYASVMDSSDIQVDSPGDVAGRFALVARQIALSVRIMNEAIGWLQAAGPGPVDVQLPKVVRAPELTAYQSIEGPLGVMGVLLDSIGEKTPWRLKLRTPAFATIQSFEATLVGLRIDQLQPMLQSCTFVIGDADR